MRAFVGIDLKKYEREFRRIKLPEVENMVPAQKHHLTFMFYDNLGRSAFTDIRRRLEGFRYRPFELEGDLLVASPTMERPDLYALGFSDESEIRDLNRRLRQHMRYQAKSYFNPHVTLLRKNKLSRGFNKNKELCGKVGPVKIDVNSVIFFESIEGKKVPIYIPRYVRKLGPFMY